MWSRACELLTQAGHKVTYRPPNTYDVEGLAKAVGIKRVNELAVEKGLAKS